jgi:hypothetical protein
MHGGRVTGPPTAADVAGRMVACLSCPSLSVTPAGAACGLRVFDLAAEQLAGTDAACGLGRWKAAPPAAEEAAPFLREIPAWAATVALWGERASRCPHRVAHASACCAGTAVRCEGGRRDGELIKTVRTCAECFAEKGPIA